MSRKPSVISLLERSLNISVNRRQFFKTSAGLLGLPPIVDARWRPKHHPRVVVLGAGLAGLTCAYYLQKSGFQCQIFESEPRPGGRIHSITDWVTPGITTELGGEFIDSNHADVLALCKIFNLSLLDMRSQSEQELVGTDYYFSGKRILTQELVEAFRPFAAKLAADQRIASTNPTSHPSVKAMDQKSINRYLGDIGIDGTLFDILTTSFTSELGISSDEQSCLNMLTVLGTDTSSGFSMYGDSDERFKIKGGNQRLITSLLTCLENNVFTNHTTERIADSGAGFKVSFNNGKQIRADFLIVTIPFSVLRNIELPASLSAEKRACIQQLGYGTQSKMFIGVQNRIWREQGFSGYLLSDQIHNGWDGSQMQAHASGPGVYNLFLGAEKGLQLEHRQVNSYVASCEKIFPGFASEVTGISKIYNWNKHAASKGAYAVYKTGQYTRFNGKEAQRSGNMLFAGEHCSTEFQGFMNGSAQTGRQAAEVILAQITKKS